MKLDKVVDPARELTPAERDAAIRLEQRARWIENMIKSAPPFTTEHIQRLTAILSTVNPR